jgi:hypothetical protein
MSVETITKVTAKATVAKNRWPDLQDVLLVVGFLCLEVGISVIWWSASRTVAVGSALILAGGLFFSMAMGWLRSSRAIK